MASRWDNNIDELGLSARQYIAAHYQAHTDYDLAALLTAAGFNTTRASVAKIRQSLGLVKSGGVAVTTGTQPAAEPRDDYAEHKLRRDIKRLKAELRDSYDERERLETLADLFVAGSQVKLDLPEWLAPVNKPPARKAAIAVAVFSDTHYDEVVKAEEVEQYNEYNRAIAEQRTENYFNNAVKLARSYVSGLTVDGFCLPMLGDIFSGNIHDELRESNEAHLLASVVHYAEIVGAGIKMLAGEFGDVYIPCIVGNHGRGTKKPRAKGRVQDNVDWLFYTLLAREFAQNERVTFDIPLSADFTFPIYSTRFRITHGDAFRGGAGIAGIWSPLMLGDHRMRKQAADMGAPYDWLLLGHFHQLGLGLSGIMLNGSIKGYDEYAYTKKFRPEPPQQAFFLVDPVHGVTLRAPIRVD